MLPDPFRSPAAFRGAFTGGLTRLVADQDGLGPFILAFNNAAFDEHVHHALRHELARRFGELAAACRRALRRGADPDEPADDLAVFLRMMAIGFEDLQPVSHRRIGPWELQFNQVRAFRPSRAAAESPRSSRAAFDANGFHFNRPFLRAETFWAGELAGRRADLLYNKFPFVDLHTLLVPDREAGAPQFLNERDHHYAWTLACELGRSLAGLAIGYNSYGACASVNHLHFQLCVRDSPLPVADARWRHNGGDQAYPLGCAAFDDAGRAWERIAALHARDLSYNLLYMPGRLYCLPRRRQGSYAVPAWCGGHSWYELTGGTICFDAERFESLGADAIEQAMAGAAPD